MDLHEHYRRNADATGHAADCRRRAVPGIGRDSRSLDPERCDRCKVLTTRPRQDPERIP